MLQKTMLITASEESSCPKWCVDLNTTDWFWTAVNLFAL
tara:strand:- start:37 stop:153 length:117 start_codon:yes stop_codon:yes gene_type:complete